MEKSCFWTDNTQATWGGMQTDMSRASALDTPTTAAYWGRRHGRVLQRSNDEFYVRLRLAQEPLDALLRVTALAEGL